MSETKIPGATITGHGAALVEVAPSKLITSRELTDFEPRKSQLNAQATYEAYKALIARTADAFGDNLRAARWLSMPSSDFGGLTPMQIAQEDGYSLRRIDPILVRLEHGIYF